MPKVLAKFFGDISRIAGFKKIEVEIPEDLTLHDLMLILKEKLGEGIYKHVVETERMEIKRTVIVFINGKNATTLNGLKSKIKDGSIVAFFPPGAGGGKVNLKFKFSVLVLLGILYPLLSYTIFSLFLS